MSQTPWINPPETMDDGLAMLQQLITACRCQLERLGTLQPSDDLGSPTLDELLSVHIRAWETACTRCEDKMKQADKQMSELASVRRHLGRAHRGTTAAFAYIIEKIDQTRPPAPTDIDSDQEDRHRKELEEKDAIIAQLRHEIRTARGQSNEPVHARNISESGSAALLLQSNKQSVKKRLRSKVKAALSRIGFHRW